MSRYPLSKPTLTSVTRPSPGAAPLRDGNRSRSMSSITSRPEAAWNWHRSPTVYCPLDFSYSAIALGMNASRSAIRRALEG
jgi:hypothetical protein